MMPTMRCVMTTLAQGELPDDRRRNSAPRRRTIASRSTASVTGRVSARTLRCPAQDPFAWETPSRLSFADFAVLGPRGQRADERTRAHSARRHRRRSRHLRSDARWRLSTTPTSIGSGSSPSPEDAVALCRANPPDAILLDHYFTSAEPAEPPPSDASPRRMRGLSGLEAVEYLRAVVPHGGDRGLHRGGGARGERRALRRDLYLRKGGEPHAALDEVVQHVLRRRGLDQQNHPKKVSRRFTSRPFRPT